MDMASKHIVITGEFLNSIPESGNVPGKFAGTSRPDVVKKIFATAAEFGWDIVMADMREDFTPRQTGKVVR